MEEAAVQRRPIKISIRKKGKNILSNSSTSADHLNNVEEPPIALNSSHLPGSPRTSSQNEVELTSAEKQGNLSMQNEENPSENSQQQLVLYNPAANGSDAQTHADPFGYTSPSFEREHPFSSQIPRVLPAVGAFTVQCAICFKWRIVPTKEKYEEIRGHILERPFFCETAREWRPEISCDDPPDIMPDGSRLWAIDKPNIAQTPAGWERLLRIRGVGSSKFADVYYVAPSGKRLRSLLEIQRYLTKHPEYAEEGFDLSQFSFLTPKPLQENYVKKRPARAAPSNDVHNLDASQADQIAWTSPEVETNLQLSCAGRSNQYSEASGSRSGTQGSKKKRSTPSKRLFNGDM